MESRKIEGWRSKVERLHVPHAAVWEVGNVWTASFSKKSSDLINELRKAAKRRARSELNPEAYGELLQSERKYRAEWRKRNREAINAAHKAWRDKNREKVRAWSKIYYDHDPARASQRVMEWKSDNQEKVKATQKKFFAGYYDDSRKLQYQIYQQLISLAGLRKPSKSRPGQGVSGS